jgi:uncharacterized membrane-anchored protein YjiN (DUF445 family)
MYTNIFFSRLSCMQFNDFVLCDIRNTLKVNTCNQNPKRRRIITSLTEEAPRENLVSSTIDTFTQELENEENNIQEMINELWEEHPAPINYVLPMGNGLDANLQVMQPYDQYFN